MQVLSQPGNDATVEPMVVTTGADGEATSTVFVGSIPGAVQVSAQCGDAPTAVITLDVSGQSTAPASLPDAGTGDLAGAADPFGLWPILMLALAGALIAAAGSIRLRDQPQLLTQVASLQAPVAVPGPTQEPETFVPRMQRLF